MLLSAAVAINKLRWTLPATCMVAPSPLFFGFMVMVQALKPLLPSTVYEYIDECIWSSFQRTVLTFFANINGTEVYNNNQHQYIAYDLTWGSSRPIVFCMMSHSPMVVVCC